MSALGQERSLAADQPDVRFAPKADFSLAHATCFRGDPGFRARYSSGISASAITEAISLRWNIRFLPLGIL
jgi:hypothetical protein